MLILKKNKCKLHRVIYLKTIIIIHLIVFSNRYLKVKSHQIIVNKIRNYLIFIVDLIRVLLFKLRIQIS